jgi:hypothetical protein
MLMMAEPVSLRTPMPTVVTVTTNVWFEADVHKKLG